MKRYRPVLTLTAAVAAMSLVLWLDGQKATTDELQARRRNVWQGFHRERVTRITVTRGGESFSLHKDGPQWLVQTANGRRPGDPLEVERLLSEIEGAEAERVLGALDGAGRTRFGFESPRVVAEVFEGNERTARITLGGAVQQERAVYVHADARGGSTAGAVIVLPGSFGEAWDRAGAEYRDRNVAQMDPSRIDRLEIRVGDRALDLARRGPVWRLATPDLGRASRGAVEAVTSQLRELRATRTLGDELDDAALARLGLASPAVRLTVRRGAVEPVTLHFGGDCPGHDGEVAARREGSRTAVCFPRAFVDALRAPPAGFVDDHVLSARTDEVAQVTVRGEGVNFTLRREAAGWQAVGNVFPVDVESVESWLSTLHDIAAGQRLEGDVRAAHGLTTPRVTLEITRSGVEGVERILVGARDEAGVAVSRDDEPVVLRFAPSLEETLRVEPLRFRPRAVVHDSEEDLRALLIDAAPLREELVRAEGMWRLARPVAGDGDATQLGELGRTLSDLDAERWVSATPRPEFGLATPRARVVARYEGAHGPGADGGTDASTARVRTYALSLGANAPGGGVYASLDGGAGVFIVPRAVLDAIAQPHLDRAAVRVLRDGVATLRLDVTGPTARSLTLRQRGDRWETDRGVSADTQSVDQLFDRLAGLSAVRVFGYGPPVPTMGFATPRVVVSATYGADGGAPRRLVLGERFGAGEGAGCCAQVDGLDATLSVPEAACEALAGFQP
ncbi:MAG: DUF4340 domain-containing protein [Polyangiales bacterium]